MMIFNKLMPELIDGLVTKHCLFDFDLRRINWVASLNNISFVGTYGHVSAIEVMDGHFHVFRCSVETFLSLVRTQVRFVALDLA